MACSLLWLGAAAALHGVENLTRGPVLTVPLSSRAHFSIRDAAHSGGGKACTPEASRGASIPETKTPQGIQRVQS